MSNEFNSDKQPSPINNDLSPKVEKIKQQYKESSKTLQSLLDGSLQTNPNGFTMIDFDPEGTAERKLNQLKNENSQEHQEIQEF